MTANAFYGDRARSLAADMVNFVTEPIDPQRLFSVILNWLHEPAVLADEAQNAHTSPAAQQPNASASLQALAIGVDYALKTWAARKYSRCDTSSGSSFSMAAPLAPSRRTCKKATGCWPGVSGTPSRSGGGRDAEDARLY